jgi:hypothetical protein
VLHAEYLTELCFFNFTARLLLRPLEQHHSRYPAIHNALIQICGTVASLALLSLPSTIVAQNASTKFTAHLRKKDPN